MSLIEPDLSAEKLRTVAKLLDDTALIEQQARAISSYPKGNNNA